MVDPSFPGGDSTCPSCGHLLWWFRDRLGDGSGQIHVDSLLLDDLGADSLDLVEPVMEIEQEFGITIPDEEAERIKTVSDRIRSIIDHRGEAA